MGVRETARGKTFLLALTVGSLSGALSAIFYSIDARQPFIKDWVPDGVVFNVFITFTSLVAAFRTSNALSRYTDAATYLHRLAAAWFDAASTLMAFCRVSQASPEQVEKFKQVLVRLFSLLNALCLEALESGGEQDIGRPDGFRFQLLGSEDFSLEVCSQFFRSSNRVECVFHMVQQLVVDAQAAGVLSIAPPILTRSHQEMGAGIFAFHEAKKIAYVPLPTAYRLITHSILAVEAIYMPFMMAHFVRGPASAFLYTFGGTFLLWFMNGVADILDNPFRKQAQTLDADAVQNELNDQLLQLLLQSGQPTPSLVIVAVTASPSGKCSMAQPSRGSTLGSWSRSTGAGRVRAEGSVGRAGVGSKLRQGFRSAQPEAGLDRGREGKSDHDGAPVVMMGTCGEESSAPPYGCPSREGGVGRAGGSVGLMWSLHRAEPSLEREAPAAERGAGRSVRIDVGDDEGAHSRADGGRAIARDAAADDRDVAPDGLPTADGARQAPAAESPEAPRRHDILVDHGRQKIARV